MMGCFAAAAAARNPITTAREIKQTKLIQHYQHGLLCPCCCSRFMFLWLSAMPWAMWAEMHWAVVPVTAAVSYLLLGIGD